MEQDFALAMVEMQKIQALQELRCCNELSQRFGLFLTEQQISNPFIDNANYEEVLQELQNSFYYFKNECHDLISDEELIEFMRRIFNGRAQGSLEYLSGTSLDELCRNTRYGYAYEDPDDIQAF